jgi:hypothetical protein
MPAEEIKAMIAGRLTMLAVVQRNTASGTDGWGQPLPPVWSTIGTLRCFAWSNQSREVVDGDKTVMVEDMRAIFLLGAGITDADEITQITDRRGNVIIPGRLKVDGPVQRKHTHLKAALKRLG